MEDKANIFLNFLYNKHFLNVIIDKWINDTCVRYNNVHDFLTFWFDAWVLYAPLDFSLNWNESSLCLFDIKHKKPNKKKKTLHEIHQFELKNAHLKTLQETFCISQAFLQSNSNFFSPFAKSVSELIAFNLFTQNKIEKKTIYFFNFKYNTNIDINKIIMLVIQRLSDVFKQARPIEEYMLIREFIFKYRNKSQLFNGLLTSNPIV